MQINSLNPSVELYNHVRAGFVAQGSTITTWCREHGINPSNARVALVGGWNGPKGRKLRSKLIAASGVAVAEEDAA